MIYNSCYYNHAVSHQHSAFVCLTLHNVMMQVLANPTADIQEGPKVTRPELKTRGVRPYDEKVILFIICIFCSA